MITLELEPYCENCPNFEPATEIFTINSGFGDLIRYDTFVKCENANKCKNMMRYLQMEGKKNDV